MPISPQEGGSAVLPRPESAPAPAAATPAPPARPAKPASPAAAPAVKTAAPAAARPAAKPSAQTSVAARLRKGSAARWDGRQLRRALSIFGINFALHAVVLILMATIFLPADVKERIFSIVSVAPEVEPEMIFEAVDVPQELEDLPEESNPVETTAEAISETPQPLDIDVSDLPPSLAMEDSTLAGPTLKLDTATAGRSEAAKGQLVQKYGGNAASELAVANGLKWLQKIQLKDGSWSFKEIGGAPNPGSVEEEANMAATACALLAYLGGGHTHEKDGPYKDTVRKGIDYLLKNAKMVPAGGDFRGNIPNNSHASMYTQGLVAIALAEAHGMTKDRRLRRATEAAVQFIMAAQDPKAGGWRYEPGKGSDTSVVGWQLMALKSAQGAKLRVPPQVFAGVNSFLDSVAAEGGSKYGYDKPTDVRQSTTAIGLLCRMYLGWDRKEPALKQGCEYLAKAGPNPNDMYYNYYATQVLHHWGGEEWDAWNAKMRDQLVNRQVKEGDHAGSFNPGGTYSGGKGGRLFETCLSVMTLEVYYRHLPLYERGNIQVEF